jgi:hypothetical protein
MNNVAWYYSPLAAFLLMVAGCYATIWGLARFDRHQ